MPVNILVPIAGGDTFFPREEFHYPKPLIEIGGIPMIQKVGENLSSIKGNMIFITKAEDCREFSLDQSIHLLCGESVKVISLKYPTQGAACTALMAVDYIDNDDPLVICNGDQVIDEDLGKIISEFQEKKLDAGIITFNSVHPRWSYVRTDDTCNVLEAAEKRVISRDAIAGFYYFKHGREFVSAVKSMIMQGDTYNGNYFVAPTINQLILAGKNVGLYRIKSENYHSFYSPQKLREYETVISKKKYAGNIMDKTTTIIPMAGKGTRFQNAGYEQPKPFIEVKGKTMIQDVMDNLRINSKKRTY